MKFKKIFFSYSRTDADFALRLALDLKKEGFDVWIDQEDIRAGSEWDLEIEKALATCDCLLFIQSEKSVASSNVLDEVYYALEQNKRVIPVLIDKCQTPFRINRLQRISFIEDYETGLANLKDNLLHSSLPDLTYDSINKGKRFADIFRVKYLFLILLAMLVIVTVIYFFNTKSKTAKPVKSVVEMLDPGTFTGEWTLKDIDQASTGKRGMLTIEDAGAGKIKILGNLQFYYPKTNDTTFFDVFNAYAGCTSCALKEEVTITDKQVDVGAHKYTILKEAQQGVGKAGDTVLDAGINTAVSASVILHLINKDSITVTIDHPDSTTGAYGVVIPPFKYSFSFKKDL
jgi:hypothetical protein